MSDTKPSRSKTPVFESALQEAAFRVRNGLSTDYQPKDSIERSILWYLKLSHSYHVGDQRTISDLEQVAAVDPKLNKMARRLAEILPYTFVEHSEVESTFDSTLNSLLDVAGAEQGPSSFWVIEALSRVSFLTLRRGQISKAESLYEEMGRLSEKHRDFQRIAESITNLGHIYALRGDMARLRPLVPRSKGWLEETGAPIFTECYFESKSHLILISDDSASLPSFLGALEEHVTEGHIPGWQSLPLANVCLCAIRTGQIDLLKEAKKRLRLCFAQNPSQSLPSLMHDVNAEMKLRFFDLMSLEEAPSSSAAFGRGKFIALEQMAAKIFRSRLQRTDGCRNEIEKVLNEGPWHPSIDLRLRLSKAYLQAKDQSLTAEERRAWEAEADQKSGQGQMISASQIRFFLLELDAIKSSLEGVIQKLSAWTGECEGEQLNFDASLGQALLKALEDPSRAPRITERTSDLNSLIVARLLAQFPWSRFAADGASQNGKLSESSHLRNSKSEKLLSLVRRAKGKPVSYAVLVQEFWNEEYDPFIHPNRLHQVAREVRKLLRKQGEDPKCLVSVYGEGYAFRAMKFHLSSSNSQRNWRRRILEFAAENINVNSKHVAELLKISERHALRLLKTLESEGTLTSTSHGKRLQFAKKSRAS